jgi:phage baseplate assembly protein W
MTTEFKYPFQIDSNGRTAATDEDGHIRELIEQVLFTAIGERVNRPTFGTNISQLVFAPNSEELAAATQLLVQGALQQWLANLILVKSVDVQSEDSTLTVTVQYIVRRNQRQQEATFVRSI